MIVCIAAIVLLLAEILLYPMFGMGAALTPQALTSGTTFLFFSLMILTVATAILALVCALCEWWWGKGRNYGLYTMAAGLGTVLIALITLFIIEL